MTAAIGRVMRRFQASREAQAGVWYIGANFLQKGIDFFSIPLFLLLLTPEQFGVTALFTTWMMLLLVVVGLQTQAAVGRAKFDHDPAAYRRYVSAVLALGTLSSLAFGLLLALLPEVLVAQVFTIDRGAVLLAALAAWGLFCCEVLWQVWRFEYRFRAYAATTAGIALARVVVSVAFILWLPGVLADVDPALGRILGMTLVNVGFGAALLAKGMADGRTLFERSYWRDALTFSLPIIPHMAAALVLAQADRVLIGQFRGLGEAGIYSFAYQAGSLISLLWSSTNSVWFPWFCEQMERDERAIIRRRARQYALGFAGFTAALMLAAPPLFALITPPEYREGLRVMPVIMVGGFLLMVYSFYVNVEYYYKKTQFVAVGTLLAAAANLALNIVLIPLYGYPAAAFTTVVSYLLLFLFHAHTAIYRLRQPTLFNFRLLLALCVGVALVALVVYSLYGGSFGR